MRDFVAGLAVCALVGVGAYSPGVAAADKKSSRPRPALVVGSVPHDFLGSDIAGNEVRISDHQGKVVIVTFWASWCAPCKKELPVLATVAKQVGPEHLKIIAINYRDGGAPFRDVVKILKDYPITMLRDDREKAAKKFEVRGIPRMIVIGRDGKVAADHTGYSEAKIPQFVEELNQLLAATAKT
jgi:thiol-disulfide isomerase/thioredoxin